LFILFDNAKMRMGL